MLPCPSAVVVQAMKPEKLVSRSISAASGNDSHISKKWQPPRRTPMAERKRFSISPRTIALLVLFSFAMVHMMAGSMESSTSAALSSDRKPQDHAASTNKLQQGPPTGQQLQQSQEMVASDDTKLASTTTLKKQVPGPFVLAVETPANQKESDNVASSSSEEKHGSLDPHVTVSPSEPEPTSKEKCLIQFKNPNITMCYFNSVNFGDELGPHVVMKMLENHFQGCSAAKVRRTNLVNLNGKQKASRQPCLFILGSVFHQTKSFDHIWGIGINPSRTHNVPSNQTIYSVRGPLTIEFLKNKLPEYKDVDIQMGDAGILVSRLFPEMNQRTKNNNSDKPRFCFVAHKNDIGHAKIKNPPRGIKIINCGQNWQRAINQIQNCDYVSSSSLHGIIVADALRIPRQWFQFNDTGTASSEGIFKYTDYFSSIGNMNVTKYRDFEHDVMDASKFSGILNKSDLKAISDRTMSSFPYHLFTKTSDRNHLTMIIE